VLAYFLPGAVGTLVLVFAVGFLTHLLMDQLSYVVAIERPGPANAPSSLLALLTSTAHRPRAAERTTGN